jgi:hypothetical protein
MPATAHTKLVFGKTVPAVDKVTTVIAIINKEFLLYIILSTSKLHKFI